MHKVKKLFNKFPERLEWISGNFLREISELTTLLTTEHTATKKEYTKTSRAKKKHEYHTQKTKQRL